MKCMNKAVALLTVALLTATLIAGCVRKETVETSVTDDPTEKTTESVTESNKSAGSTEKANEDGEISQEDYEGTITMWGWDEDFFGKTIAAFNDVYPNIRIEYTPVQANDYLQKIQTSSVAGLKMPDILMAEAGWSAMIYSLDIWENLEAAPYNFDRSKVLDFVHNLTSNEEGDIVSCMESLSPMALAYRRDLALEYLGTDDPRELEAMLSTWDDFIEVGKEVLEKSNGEIHMFTGTGDAFISLEKQLSEPFVEGDVINVREGAIRGIFEKIVAMRDAGITDKIQAWGNAWFPSYAEGRHMFYPAANWIPPFIIKPNDVDGEGNWGLMTPPEGGGSWGGTAIGISKISENKELAWKYIEWLTLSEDGAQFIADEFDRLSALKTMNARPSSGGGDPYMGGQDIEGFWKELMKDITVRPISKHDKPIFDTILTVAEVLKEDETMGVDQALEMIAEELGNVLPGVTVK